jgi:hypothetical protein
MLVNQASALAAEGRGREFSRELSRRAFTV